MMVRLTSLVLIGIGLVITFSPSPVRASACGEPTPAPNYQPGDEWTWRDEKGTESRNVVLGVEGDTTRIQWSNGDVAFYDKDWIIRKVQRRNGEVLTTQGAGGYTTIGVKYLDFPLSVGKKWGYSYLSTPASGATGLRTYTHDFKVQSCEEVVTPAGKFPALKIEVEQGTVGSSYSGIFYLWWSPQLKNFVKREYRPSQWWSSRVRDTEVIKYAVR